MPRQFQPRKPRKPLCGHGKVLAKESHSGQLNRFRAAAGASVPSVVKNKIRKETKMKNIDIDWNELAKAVIKAVWPFIAGAVGGLFAGCTVNSPVP